MKDMHRLVRIALENGEVMDSHREYLMSLPLDTLDEQERAYKELLACGIKTKLAKGAAYIEEIGPTHSHYQAAIRKYNKLCQELEALEHDSSVRNSNGQSA